MSFCLLLVQLGQTLFDNELVSSSSCFTPHCVEGQKCCFVITLRVRREGMEDFCMLFYTFMRICSMCTLTVLSCCFSVQLECLDSTPEAVCRRCRGGRRWELLLNDELPWRWRASPAPRRLRVHRARVPGRLGRGHCLLPCVGPQGHVGRRGNRAGDRASEAGPHTALRSGRGEGVWR